MIREVLTSCLIGRHTARLENMAAQYKIIHPLKYYRDYLANDVRPDCRALEQFRPATVNVGSINSADGSAIVKIGDTTVVCGIKAELTKPNQKTPDRGFLVPNVELPALCSTRYRPGPPSDQAQVLSQFVADVIANSGCVDLKALCISPENLVWVLYCDLICLNHDGSVADACVIAIIAALRSIKLPTVKFDADKNTTSISEEKSQLKINNLPVAVTHAIFDDNILLTDPCADEENLCVGLLTIAVKGDELCLFLKPGGASLSPTQLQKCIKTTMKRAVAINRLVETALTS